MPREITKGLLRSKAPQGDVLGSLLQQLMAEAQPRRDLGIEGPAATYLGRLVPFDPSGAESRSLLESVLSRPQDNPPDVEGYSGAVQSLLKASPLMAQGIIGSKIRQSQGRTGALAGARAHFDPLSSAVESRRRAVLKSPGFEKFRERLLEQLRKQYGEDLTLYRGVAPKELESLKSGLIPDLAGFTLAKDIAANFASPGGAIIKAKAPLQSVLFRPPHTGPFGLEAEIVANPQKFINLMLESRIPSVKEAGSLVDLLSGFQPSFNPFGPLPLAPEHQLINQTLQELFSKGFK